MAQHIENLAMMKDVLISHGYVCDNFIETESGFYYKFHLYVKYSLAYQEVTIFYEYNKGYGFETTLANGKGNQTLLKFANDRLSFVKFKEKVTQAIIVKKSLKSC